MSQPPAQLILFGDQAVPYRDGIQKLLARSKDSPVLAMVLADGHRALVREILDIPPGHTRPAVAKLASLDEMMDGEETSPAASCALDSALVCLVQIASFISYELPLPHIPTPFLSPAKCVCACRTIG